MPATLKNVFKAATVDGAQTDLAVWDPATGYRVRWTGLVISTVNINVVTFEFGTTAQFKANMGAGTSIAYKFDKYRQGDIDANLLLTTTAAGGFSYYLEGEEV